MSVERGEVVLTTSIPSGQSELLRQISRQLAFLTLAIGLLITLGWAFNIEIIIRPLSGLPTMHPVTAVCFIITSISLGLISRRTQYGPVASIPSTIVLLVAIIKLSQLWPGIDHLMFEAETNAMSSTMATNSAMNFVLLSMACILTTFGTKKTKDIANVLAATTALFAIYSILGYIYRVPEFFIGLSYFTMAIHTAIAFVIASLSLLLRNSEDGFMSVITSPYSGGVIARTILPATILVPALIGYIRLYAFRSNAFSMELGDSVVIASIIVLYFVMIIYVSAETNKKDARRHVAEEDLGRLNAELEKKVAERTSEILAQEKRFRALIEHSNDGLSLIDAASQIVYQSPAVGKIIGYTIEERRNAQVFSMIHPDFITSAIETWTKVMANPGVAYPFEQRYLHKNGHYIWIEGVVVNLLNDPTVQAVVTNFRDITDRRQQEERIARSEKHFKALIDNSADAIVLTDHDLKVLYQSPSVERMTGISMEYRRSNPGISYSHPDDLPALTSLIERSKQSPGKTIPFSIRILHRFGHHLWIEGVMTNLLNDPAVEALVFNYRDVSERKILEQQQALSAALVNSSNDAIIGIDKSNVIMSWNHGAQKLFGYTSQEAVGESIMILVPGEFRQQEASVLARIVRGDIIENFETKRIRKDGRIASISVTSSPIYNPQGEVIGISSISRDISERIEGERKLNQERNLLRTLIDNLPDYIYVKNTESKHIINNKAMIGLIGADSDQETLGKSSIDFFGEQVARPYLEEDAAIIKSGLPMLNFEEMTITRAGEKKFLLTTKVPLKDDHGVITGIVGISRDITQQKKTEIDLRNSKYFLEKAQEVAQVGHWTLETGSTSNVVWSDETARILGINNATEGNKLQIMTSSVHPDDQAMVNRVITGVIVNGSAYSIEHRVLIKGKVRWVQHQAEAAFDESRGITIVMGIIQDITQRKKNESEILSLNRSLEAKVSQRTAQLEAVNKELEAFTYSVSHDLRAPLRIINGFATILLEDADKLDGAMTKHIHTISRNATRMGQLIDDLLNFSRLGRTHIKMSKVDMNDLVQQAIEEVPDAQKFVKVGTLKEAVGDNSLLKQVWINLISNAVKYSGRTEKPLIEVGMVKHEKGDAYYVKDNGAGFDMQYASKLFGVFQRLHKQDEFAGTGVGLALVQRIITRHGGEVWAEGKVNHGATFYFRLPDQ